MHLVFFLAYNAIVCTIDNYLSKLNLQNYTVMNIIYLRNS